MSIINPTAKQVEKMNGDCEVQALLSSPDEVEQAYSTAKREGEKVNFTRNSISIFKLEGTLSDNIIWKSYTDLVQTNHVLYKQAKMNPLCHTFSSFFKKCILEAGGETIYSSSILGNTGKLTA